MEFVKSLWNNPTCMRYIKIGGAIFFSGMAFLDHLRLFDNVTFEERIFKARTIVYMQLQGDFCDLGKAFRLMKTLINKTFEGKETLGIYYDNPCEIVDKN